MTATLEQHEQYHLYLPWSQATLGEPPEGAVALCGHVRDGVSRGHVPLAHPDACLECRSRLNLDLAP